MTRPTENHLVDAPIAALTISTLSAATLRMSGDVELSAVKAHGTAPAAAEGHHTAVITSNTGCMWVGRLWESRGGSQP